MPTYAYRCDACGHEFDEFQPITAKSMRKCPKCGKQQLRRLLGTGSGIIFKGSGFYQTDYRSDGYRKAAGGDSKAGAAKKDTSKKDEASGSSASATPTEPKSGAVKKSA
jgi:putative FmdB family regulatory protein